MKEVDPLQHESTWTAAERNSQRRMLLAAASVPQAPAAIRSRSRVPVFVILALAVIAASLLGLRGRSPLVSDLQAAVRFEVRLAEDNPAPGLREAKVSGSERSVYLHDEIVVDNGDIAAVSVISGSGSSQYGVGIELNAPGAEKIREATTNRIGKPLAILLDGQVVMTPLVRVPIGASAVITNNFTKGEAERIVNGLGFGK